MKAEYLSNNPSQTKRIGKALAEKILKGEPEKIAQILALQGDLGGGKTTFLQGFARGLGVKDKILSPTFVILRKFKIKRQSCRESKATAKFKTFYHIDCYRIEKPKELLSLGFKRIVSDSQNIVAVEWAEHIKKILPQNAISINFEFISKNKRKIIIRWKKKKNV